MSVPSPAPAPSTRRRLTQQESRQVAMVAARDILLEAGPQAVTLKAVAGRIGRTHANLLHHFGSASGLQKALVAYICQNISVMIADALTAFWSGGAPENVDTPRIIVDLAFDTFDKEGAGKLVTWLLAVDDDSALEPIVDTVHALVNQMRQHEQSTDMLPEITLKLVLMALGHSLIGAPLARSLGLPADAARERAVIMVRTALQSTVR